MSIAYHFQLDPEKPDEERAMMLLEAWQRAGWNLQKIMVMALLSLGSSQSTHPSPDGQIDDLREFLQDFQEQSLGNLDEANRVLYQVQELLERMQNMSFASHKEPEGEQISTAFVASVKKTIKPGIRLED